MSKRKQSPLFLVKETITYIDPILGPKKTTKKYLTSNYVEDSYTDKLTVDVEPLNRKSYRITDKIQRVSSKKQERNG